MLTIRCSKCKNKLFKYRKIGKGKVLKCYKTRIYKIYKIEQEDDSFRCICGNLIGKDEVDYIKMNDQGFIYTGTKE